MKSLYFLITYIALFIAIPANTAIAVNNSPRLYYTPHNVVVEKGQVFKDNIIVTDPDLFDKEKTEVLIIEVIEPDSITIEPDTISGPLLDGFGEPVTDTLIKLILQSDRKNWLVNENYQVEVKVKVTDKDGLSFVYPIVVSIAEHVSWKCKMTAENVKVVRTELVFGQSMTATSGYGDDGFPEGKLDSQFVEWQLLPVQANTTFDARWVIPGTTGTLWNIQPIKNGPVKFKGSFIDQTNYSSKDTVKFRWYRYDIPDVNDTEKNQYGYRWFICDGETEGALFKYDMRSLSTIVNSPGISEIVNNNNIAEMTVFGATSTFMIKNDYMPDGITDCSEASGITITPNPATEMINLDMYGDVSAIEIYNSVGVLVYKKIIQGISNEHNRVQLDVSWLAPGMYILNTRLLGTIRSATFIKTE